MTSDDPLSQVRALVGLEVSRPDDKPRALGQLQRLCRAAAFALPATGVGVSVMSRRGGQVSLAASSAADEAIEELQFTMGEGPCLDAYQSRGPVLMPDLTTSARTRWPGYAPAAHEHGVRAVFAFPLQVGAARLGAFDVYQNRVGPLPSRTMRQALSFADLATQTLLDAQRDPDLPEREAGSGSDAPVDADDASTARDALVNRAELYQAQGMVMIQLGVSLDEAMSRLRAYAYGHDRRLSDVAHEIVTRRLTLEDDSA